MGGRVLPARASASREPGARSRRPRRASGGDRAVDVGVGRVARQREAQHAGAVVDADRLQRGAGAGACARRRPSRPRRARRAPRARAAAARRAGPGRPARRCAGARGAPVTVGRAPGTTPRQRGQRRLLEAIAQRRDRRLGAGLERRRGASVGGDAEADQRGQVLGAAAQARAPGRRRPTAARGARPAAATARPRPAARAACARRARRCRRRARAGAGATGRTPARRRRAGGGGRRSRRAAPSRRAISATGCSVPSSLLHQHDRDDARCRGAPRRRRPRRGRRRPAPGAHHVERRSPRPTSASALRMTAGCSSALTTRWRPRAARAAPSTPSASASVPPLVKTISAGLDVQRRGHLARAPPRGRAPPPRPARAPRPGWRRARAAVARSAVQHLGRGPRRGGVVQVNHRDATIAAPGPPSRLGRAGSLR